MRMTEQFPALGEGRDDEVDEVEAEKVVFDMRLVGVFKYRFEAHTEFADVFADVLEGIVWKCFGEIVGGIVGKLI